MTDKYKDFFTYAGLTTGCVSAEAGWTALLVWLSSKIPYVGIPIAALLGAGGATSIFFLINGGRLCYLDWYKTYCASKK